MQEMIVHRQGSKSDDFLAEIQGVQKVNEIKILGVIVSKSLSFEIYLDTKLRDTAQVLYALKVLKSHRLNKKWDVTKATFIPKVVLHASPVW